MKKIFFATLATSLLTSSAFAFNAFSALEAGNLEAVILIDGRTFNIEQDIEALHLYDNQVDFLELQDGEIVDRLDINHFQLNNGSHQLIRMATGVDGGG